MGIDRALMERLCAPFENVSWKPQAVRGERALMVCYIDARDVAERLDECVCGEWEFYWSTELATPEHVAVRGKLVVLDTAREDVGEAFASEGQEEPIYKAAVSDALKRCAVLFGIGRYLYRLPQIWVRWDTQRRAPAQGEVERLNEMYKKYIRNLGSFSDPTEEPEPTTEPEPAPKPEPKPAKASEEPNNYWGKEQINAFFNFVRSKGIPAQKALDILGVKAITLYSGTLEDAMDEVASTLEG